MRIRSEQFAALDDDVKRRFITRVAAAMRDWFPEQTATVSELDLVTRIQASAKTAREYGITSERGIARFAGMSLVFGEKFHEIGQIRQALKRGGREAEEFLEWLLDECAREASEEAAKLPS